MAPVWLFFSFEDLCGYKFYTFGKLYFANANMNYVHPIFISSIAMLKFLFTETSLNKYGPLRHILMMMIPPNIVPLRGEEVGEVKGEYGGIKREEEGNADYGGMVHLSQQHVVSCVKGLLA